MNAFPGRAALMAAINRPAKKPPSDYFVCTLITRTDEDGETGEWDTVVYFNVESFTPGYAATWDEPGCGDEFEFSFVTAELDGADPGEVLTPAEIAALKVWFETDPNAYEKACDSADGCGSDDYDDGAYDRYRDAQMERGF